MSLSEAPREDRVLDQLGPWFHNLHLPDGRQTAPHHVLGDFPRFKWRRIEHAVPADLSGWSVLDVGCNAGFYSFELARRGAFVRGIDVDPHYLRQARWAVEQLGLADRVRFEQRQVYDLAREDEQYDLIWFMGVFYHLRHPLLALDILARKTRRLLMFQTMSFPEPEILETPGDLPLDDRDRLLQPGWPRMAFIEHRLAGDPTNWWAANAACAEAMLRSSGLRILDRPAREIYLCEPHWTDPLAIGRLLDDEYASATGTALRSRSAASESASDDRR